MSMQRPLNGPLEIAVLILTERNRPAFARHQINFTADRMRESECPLGYWVDFQLDRAGVMLLLFRHALLYPGDQALCQVDLRL